MASAYSEHWDSNSWVHKLLLSKARKLMRLEEGVHHKLNLRSLVPLPGKV